MFNVIQKLEIVDIPEGRLVLKGEWLNQGEISVFHIPVEPQDVFKTLEAMKREVL